MAMKEKELIVYRKLKEDKLLSEYYFIRYDIWLEDVAKHYNKLNTVLSDVQTKVIIGHEFLVGDRVLDLDELEADIENRLEGAIKDQDQHQNDLLTSESVAVAEAWNMLYNATSIMQELSDRVDEINAELDKARKNLAMIEGKLSNEKFVSKAPEAVVNAEREKAAKTRDLIAQLEQSLAAMQKMA